MINGTLSDEIKTETSKDGGNVKFTGLKAGIYYLKETKVADGYLPSNSIYTVEVTNSADGNSATAVLKNSKGKAIDVIYNQKYENVVETEKTAQLVNWDERTYNITLNASSKAQDILETDPVEVVLVLDTSGSMHFRSTLQPYSNCTVANLEGEGPYYYVAPTDAATMYRVYKSGDKWYYIDDSKWDYTKNTGNGTIIPKESKDGLDLSNSFQFYTTNDDNDRFYYLKKAATEFTNELESLSADSKVALVPFNKTVESDNVLELQKVGSNLSEINTAIQNMQTSGGTNQYLGLDEAKSLLIGDKNKENLKRYVILLTDGCPNGSTYKELEDSANALKNETGATLMTIGVGMGGSNTHLNTAKGKLNEIASDNNGTKYAYTVEEANQLSSIFRSILQSVAGVPVANVTVKDYIDSRFDVIESTVPDGGTVGKDDKGTYVIWQNETIGVATGSSSGWKKTFQVKAKPEYIGGNDVTTNGNGSGVFVGDKKIASFGRPTVNVKVDFNIGSNETVIFKGDDLRDHFTDTVASAITKLEPTTGVEEYTTTGDVTISTKWYTDEACTTETEITKEAIQKAKPTADTVYYAKVTVTPKTDGSTSKDNSIGDGKADGGYYKVDSAGVAKTGTYTVKVVSGQIQITKKIDVAFDENKSFTFEIKKGNELIATAIAEIQKDSTYAKVKYTRADGVDSQILTMRFLIQMVTG